MSKNKSELQEKDIEEVKIWLNESSFLPESIRSKILCLCDLFEAIKEKEIRHKGTVDRLKEAQGISPISERGGQNKDLIQNSNS